jgi:hypothetical protein
MYGAGYPPAYSPNPTGQMAPGYWSPGQPPVSPGGPSDGGDGGPPEPARPPGWLWLLAGVTVLLVVGLVIALVIANGSAKKPSTVSQSPSPTMPSMTAPPRIPTMTPTRPRPPRRTTVPSVPPPPRSGAAQTIVYKVNGEGRAISIAYIDSGGVLQTEFNVLLPWSKEVSLAAPASTAASVTVVNVGERVTCSVSVDGQQVLQRSGTILTICTAAG